MMIHTNQKQTYDCSIHSIYRIQVFSLLSFQQIDLLRKNKQYSVHIYYVAYSFIIGRKASRAVSNTIDCLVMTKDKLCSCFSNESFNLLICVAVEFIIILVISILFLSDSSVHFVFIVSLRVIIIDANWSIAATLSLIMFAMSVKH